MPRGVRKQPPTTDQQIASLELEIKNAEEKLNLLRSEMEALVARRDQEQMEKLMAAMREKRLTADDVLAKIEQL